MCGYRGRTHCCRARGRCKRSHICCPDRGGDPTEAVDWASALSRLGASTCFPSSLLLALGNSHTSHLPLGHMTLLLEAASLDKRNRRHIWFYHLLKIATRTVDTSSSSSCCGLPLPTSHLRPRTSLLPPPTSHLSSPTSHLPPPDSKSNRFHLPRMMSLLIPV